MDPNYKKLRKHYLKSTKNRDESLSKDWSAFRRVEKKYMARFPPPDLSATLDVRNLSSGSESKATLCTEVAGPSSSPQRIFAFPHIPGLVVLPSFIDEQEQRRLTKWALRDHAKSPNPTNLDIHYHLPPEGLWNQHLSSISNTNTSDCPLIQPRAASSDDRGKPTSGPRELIDNEAASETNFTALRDTPKPEAPSEAQLKPATSTSLIAKLRWANIGWYYHWGTKQYDFTRGKGPINQELESLCRNAVRTVNWETVFSPLEQEFTEWRDWDESYVPDAGIVNFYQTKDTLMAHVDRSEVCATSPLVSISLGNSAIFLIGGTTRDEEPTPIILHSGDVVIMAGPVCRRAYHGVPRILPGTLPNHLVIDPDDEEEWVPYHKYIANSRINVNVRQVFPKGFTPPIASP
ncbi:hypothetical protein BDV98DRAFT_519575 [Pterulicium gracile]|uniref:Fe2OG dioxygenase domain-containing protein n=1 Tax=Pterulicium gracile TaxID=1884261 RepID=A0A5C3QYG3_9AGAR|nr:hypothetical protein BDV98DRAFT_519575 [Pterula gracilis]